jgi:hypothetical protein
MSVGRISRDVSGFENFIGDARDDDEPRETKVDHPKNRRAAVSKRSCKNIFTELRRGIARMQ